MRIARVLDWWMSGGSVVDTLFYSTVISRADTSLYKKPSSGQQTLQDTLFTSLKTSGVLQVMDVVRVKATNGSPNFAGLNWVAPSLNQAVNVLGVNHYYNQGFRGSDQGVNNYLNENWIPSNGINFQKDSCEIIVYYKEITTGVFPDGSRVANGDDILAINPSASSGVAHAFVNNDTVDFAATDAQFNLTEGIYFMGRLNVTQVFIRKGSGARVILTQNSTERSTYSFVSGAINTGGVISDYNTRMQVLFCAGALLTTTQEDEIKTYFETYLSGIASDTQTTLGTIYNKSSWTNLTDFSDVSSGCTVVGNKLSFTGGGGTFVKRLDLNTGNHAVTALEKWKITALVTVGTKNGSSFGFGFGLESVSAGAKYHCRFNFDMTDGSTSGRTNLRSGPSNSIVLTETNATSFSVGNQLEVTIERNFDLITMTKRNITTASALITSNYRFPASVTIEPNSSKFTILNFGGSFTVDSLLINSNEITGAKYCASGDSKTLRYAASYHNGRYPFILSQYVGTVVVNAGGDDRTADVLARLPELIALNADNYILNIGSNDARNGVASATYNANLSSIASGIVGAGKRVVFLTGFAETILDQSPMRNYIIANYSNDDIIDTLPEAFTLAADGVHLNDAGCSEAGIFVATSGKL